MRIRGWFVALFSSVVLIGCTGGSSGTGGEFALIEFLESGQNNIPRNRQVRFRFSSPVAEGQDLFTRLKIQNVNAVPGDSNFARARGFYLLNAEMVIFTPQLPNKPDRTDAGFKANGNYHVFLSGGPDGLTSTSGDTIPTQQEFIFETNQYFEDVIPAEPPRGLQLLAIDPTGVLPNKDLSRADPRAFEQAKLSTQKLLDAGNIIDPGAGGDPFYPTPWRFELRISETVDPLTVNGNTVQLNEIRENVFETMPDVPWDEPDNPQGDLLAPALRVSATVEVVQSIDSATGDYDIRIRVTPLQTLVDNTRYRLTFSGAVLGIDYRKTFSGDNGLTGDGATATPDGVYTEPGGLGYTSEFLVYDRAGISASRTLLYDPILDGIQPEKGQTATTEEDLNSALYNPSFSPGTALGFLSAFGDGRDGPFAVSGSKVTSLDTGDTPNEPLGNPFTVQDLNPQNDYLGNPLPGAPVPYDSVEPFEFQIESLVVSRTSTLRITGVNPVLFRVSGIVEIQGEIDLRGEDGAAASGSGSGGKAGAGGFEGGNSRRGSANCTNTWGTCSSFATYLNACSQAKVNFPNALNGTGPGRGYAGGEAYNYDYADDRNNSATGTGGGGGGHALVGADGEDRMNNGAEGSVGNACAINSRIKNSGVIGVRSKGGAAYGDREVIAVNMGGSGGAGGGSTYAWGGNAKATSGGGGGGGGGSIGIVAAGNILVPGGEINANGGNGGKGNMGSASTTQSWYSVGGAGGGGGGGTIALISGGDIELTAGDISAVGGNGGARANNYAGGCTGCNAGGNGGNGFIFLMDADGDITGFLPMGGLTGGDPNAEEPEALEYDKDPRGVLTVSPFIADRFSSITAITELFPVTTAKPTYVDFSIPKNHIVGNVANDTQTITVSVTSALSNAEDPTVADPSSEQLAPINIALLHYASNGSTEVTRIGDIRELNAVPGVGDRRAFVRVRAAFKYGVGVEAALGPFATIDEVTISYDFND